MPIADAYSVVRTINKAGAINVYGFYSNFLLLLYIGIVYIYTRKDSGGGFLSVFLCQSKSTNQHSEFFALFFVCLFARCLTTRKMYPYKNGFFCKRKGKNWTFTFLNKTFKGKVAFFILLWYFTY